MPLFGGGIPFFFHATLGNARIGLLYLLIS